MFLLFLLSNALTVTATDSQTHITIGAIFDQKPQQLAFKLAVDFVNSQGIIGHQVQLKYLLNETKLINSADSVRLACIYAQKGVSAIVGPLSSTATKAVTTITRALNIPQIAPIATNPMLSNNELYPWLVRMMAADSAQSLAIADLVRHYGWKKMAILTSDTDYGINGLMEFQAQAAREDWRITSVLTFVASDDPLNTNATEQLLIIKETRVRVIILNCLSYYGQVIMRQAEELGLTGPGWAWIVTDGVTGGYDASATSPAPSNMVGFLGTRPKPDNGSLWETYVQFIENKNLTAQERDDMFLAYSAFSFDSVLTIGYAIRDLVNANKLWIFGQPSLSCDDKNPTAWEHGYEFLDAIRKVKGPGVVESIEFDENAGPLHFTYDIVNLLPHGWSRVGNWASSSGLTMDDNATVIFHGNGTEVVDYIGQLANQTVRVVVIADLPFVKLKNPVDPFDVQENELEGFSVDLMRKLAELIGFKYTIYVVPDNNFGIKDDDTQKWNGLVRELVDRRADIALASLTINRNREVDIDFTKPYMDLGMRFVLKSEQEQKLHPFAFLEPLDNGVWTYILVTTVVVGIWVSIVNKLSPYDYHGEFIHIDKENRITRNFKEYKQYKRIKTHAMNELGFANAFWFSVASLLQQGGETYPKSLSGRITTVAWWLATVIIVATYTANLAAYLTKSRTSTTINSVEDLGTQSKVAYGTVHSSSVEQYFKDSEVTLFKQMREAMESSNSNVNNTKIGVEKSRNEDFAFIWDSPVLDYAAQSKPCDTIESVGRVFGQVGYGYGLQKNSVYSDELSRYILHLRESGFMDELQVKWFQQKTECATESAQSEHEQQVEAAGGQLDLENFLGVFYIIYGGLVLSIIVLVFEWVVGCLAAVDWKGQDPFMKPRSFKEALIRRWKAMVYDFKEEIDITLGRQPPHERKERNMFADISALAVRMNKLRSSIANGQSSTNLIENSNTSESEQKNEPSSASNENPVIEAKEAYDDLSLKDLDLWKPPELSDVTTYVYNGQITKFSSSSTNGIFSSFTPDVNVIHRSNTVQSVDSDYGSISHIAPPRDSLSILEEAESENDVNHEGSWTQASSSSMSPSLDDRPSHPLHNTQSSPNHFYTNDSVYHHFYME